jgi:uncharacterized protein (DUF1015 family)
MRPAIVVYMPRFEPFAALRFGPSLPLGEVTAPPYDVLSSADTEALAARHQRNVVAIDVPRPDDDPERYNRSAAVLADWCSDGTLIRDPRPSFTLYRMAFTTEAGTRRETVGVLGALEVVDLGAGGVLPHERTTPKATTDRLDLTRAAEANLSPVWGLSLTAGLTEVLAAPGEPMGSFVDDNGVTHTVERVDEPSRVAEIAAAVSSNPVLIADGHHRYAISRTYRDERRATDGAGPWDLTLTYVGELVESQLSIDAIHRLYRGVSIDALTAILAESFEMAPAGPIDATFAQQVVARGALCLVHDDGTGTWLTPRPEMFAGIRSLDGALLERAFRDAAVDVSYQHGVQNVVDLVAGGAVDAGILIRPTGIDEIRRTADEGLLMPPKSTFFTPKLRTGLVMRPLD